MIRKGRKLKKKAGRVMALLLSCAVACGSMTLPASAAEDSSSEESSSYVLLPSAGFAYAFSAKKVSLRDVEDQMYSEGVITAKRTSSDNTLTLTVSAAETSDPEAETGEDEEAAEAEAAEEASDEEETAEEEAVQESSEDETSEEDRVIEETTLTPVQKKEQSVVNAVSETQNITVDTATATILSATAVSVVSDTDTAVALQEMVDKKQTQAKLDQGVISAVEAEALMAVYDSDMVVDGSGTSSGASSDTDTAAEDTAETGEDASGTDGETTDQLTAVATDDDGNEIVVAQVSDYINIRADADAESEIVGYLYNGSVATVLGRTGNGWVRIESGGIYGYIREEYVATGSTAAALAEEVATQQAVVTTETLRVRAAPQADSDVISLIGEGETLDILEVVDGWYKVNTVDGEGYISADFADVEQVYPTAVAVEDTEEESTDDSSSSTSSSSTSSSSSSGSSYSSLNSYTGGSGSGTSSGSAVANYALQFVGNPYVWGGTSLTNGADCSGFTMAVYANFGVSLPHSSYSQASCGTAVASLDEAQAGDLLIYDGHVAIYLGNNQIVHASNPANGICVGTATYRTIIAIRRIFN